MTREDHHQNDYFPDRAVQPEPPPFRFFDLPLELREKIYLFALFTPSTGPRRLRRKYMVRPTSGPPAPPVPTLRGRLNMFLVSRRFHDEVAYLLYSSHTFALFYEPERALVLPPVGAVAPRYRALIRSSQLTLGANWTNPPKSWAVTRRLGLHHMTMLRLLRIFVQCDPSHPAFEGFRISTTFYTEFSGALLRDVLLAAPSLMYVELDAYPSVQKDGPLVSRLVHEAESRGKKVIWVRKPA